MAPLLNKLYRTEWRLFHNFFCPSVKLIAKNRVGPKRIKRYDAPKTPAQRVMESPHVEPSVKQTLAKQLEELNPFVLRKAIDNRLKKVFAVNTRPR